MSTDNNLPVAPPAPLRYVSSPNPLPHDPMDRSPVGGTASSLPGMPTLAHDPTFEALLQDGNETPGMGDPVAACYAFEPNGEGVSGGALSPLGLFGDYAMTANGVSWSTPGSVFDGVADGPGLGDAAVDGLRAGMVDTTKSPSIAGMSTDSSPKAGILESVAMDLSDNSAGGGAPSSPLAVRSVLGRSPSPVRALARDLTPSYDAGGVVSSLAHGMGKMRAKTPDTPKPYDAEETPETSPDTSPETSPETSVPTGHTAPHVGQIVMYRSVLHQIKEMHAEKGDEGPSCVLWRSYPVHQYTIAHMDMHLVRPAPGVFYVTNENDTIALVAKDHSVTPASLVAANAHLKGITKRSKFFANTIMYIPA